MERWIEEYLAWNPVGEQPTGHMTVAGELEESE